MVRQDMACLIAYASLTVLTVAGCGTSDGPLASPAPTTSSFEPTSGHIEEEVGRPIGLFCVPHGTIDTCDIKFTVTAIRQVDPSNCGAADGFAGGFAAIDVNVMTRGTFSQPEVGSALGWERWSYVDDRSSIVSKPELAPECTDNRNAEIFNGDLPRDATVEATLVLKTPNGIRSVRVDSPRNPYGYEWEASR